jgi:hypothetical protein
MKKITKNTILSEVLKKPESEKILAKFNFPCLTCPMGKMEMEMLKIGQVCEMYGIDLEKILKELNKKD